MVLRSPVNALWGMLPEVLDAGVAVDRVELKVLLDGEFESALSVLGREVNPPQVRRLHYLDTPDLALLRRGVIVRARATAGVGDEVVVKLRHRRPDMQRLTRGLALELDALPTEAAWAASLRRGLRAGHVRRVIDRRGPSRHLLGRAQRTLLRSAVGDDVDLEGLVSVGPVDVVRLTSGRSGDRIGIESWTLPDSSRILELFAKCSPARSPAVADQVRTLIAEHGLVLSKRQAAKSRMLLLQMSEPGFV
jgi:hypothetical protein